MAKFCGKCGTGLDAATGLCPNCDKEKLAAMAPKPKFCVVCGSKKDDVTGECPNCSKKEIPLGNTVPFFEETPASMPAPEKKAKKKKPKALTTIFTILLSVLFFVTTVLTVTVLEVRNTFKEDNLEKVLKDVQIIEMITDNDLVADEDLDRFYDFIDRRYDAIIGNKQLENLINESSVKEYAAEKIADFAEDFLDGRGEFVIDRDEITDLIEDNADVIENECDVYLDRDDVDNIVNWVFDEETSFVLMDIDEFKDTQAGTYNLIKYPLSMVGLIVLIILCAVFIALMILNSVSQAACGVGINFIILGALTGAAALIVSFITPLWESINAGSPVIMLIGEIIAVNALISIVLLVVGVALLVTRAVVKKIRAKR